MAAKAAALKDGLDRRVSEDVRRGAQPRSMRVAFVTSILERYEHC